MRVFGNEGAEPTSPPSATLRVRGRRQLRIHRRRRHGAAHTRHPRGALGRAPEGTMVVDPETGRQCPPARSTTTACCSTPRRPWASWSRPKGAAGSRGTGTTTRPSWRACATGGTGPATSPIATRRGTSIRRAVPMTGCVSTGRTSGRTGGARLERHPDVVLAAVYAVPDPVVGDQVMAALELRPGAVFDPAAFATFLDAQGDLGTKWAPRFVRVCPSCPSPPRPRCSCAPCGPSVGTVPTRCGGEQATRDGPYRRLESAESRSSRSRSGPVIGDEPRRRRPHRCRGSPSRRRRHDARATTPCRRRW